VYAPISIDPARTRIFIEHAKFRAPQLLAYAMGLPSFDEMVVVTGDAGAICVAEGLGMQVWSLQEALEGVGRHNVAYPADRREATTAKVKELKQRGQQKRTEGKVFDPAKLAAWEAARPMP
jgi:hypothetical protein